MSKSNTNVNYSGNNNFYIDIFSGCGGLSLGLHNSGWKGLFAIEKNEMAFETLKFNLIDKNHHFEWVDWLKVEAWDINKLIKKHESDLADLKGKVTLVAGGPPCQGFSIAGRRNESDDRNKLIDSYIEFIELVQPKFLLFENVKGFNIGFKKKNGKRGTAYSEHVIGRLKALGYIVDAKLVDFSRFGVPQRRKRFIISGVRNDLTKKNDFFDRLESLRLDFLKDKGLNNKVNVKQAISDLLQEYGKRDSVECPRFKEGCYGKSMTNYQRLMKKNFKGKFPDSHRFANHNDNTISKFSIFLKEANRNLNVSSELKQRFNLKKHCVIPLCEKSQAPTLTTLPDDYIHYCEPRILTVREYARIQSFPDNFEFKGKYTTGGKWRKLEVPRYTQIGNAIPPLFGEIVGKVIKEWDIDLSKEEIKVSISESKAKEEVKT